MSSFIAAWFGISLVVVGMSRAARPRLWADFFVAMKRTGFAPLIIGMYTLPTGLLIVLGHNRWDWDWPLIVTVAGWGMTIKASTYMVFPRAANRMIENADRWESSFTVFRVVGALMIALGAVLTWHTYAVIL